MPSIPFAESKFSAALSELSDIRDPQSLRVNIVRTIARQLIHAEDGSFDHIDYANRTAIWDSIRPLPGETGRIDAACRYFSAHPLLELHRSGEAPAVLRLSDVQTSRTFERNPLYQELYRPIGMRHIMLLRLSSGTKIHNITLLRSNRDFSAREAALLRSISPLVVMLSKLAAERESLRQALATAAPGRGVILLADDDSIAWANPCAREQLSHFFDWVSESSLPPKIASWLVSPIAPLLQASGPARLKMAVVQNDQQRMLLCDEMPAEPAPHQLQKLGLTPRQSEVLFWISRGKTNSEIGIILGASVHTINRHVEAIFQRLHVESRSAAMVSALEILGT